MSKSRPWAGPLRLPSLDDFERIARDVYSDLDPAFQDLARDVIIRVADFADRETLAMMGMEDPYELLGLFHGIGLAQGAAVDHTGQMPNQIWLYRRPILAYWVEHDDDLNHIIAHVLIHELGHHFGFSDEDMDEIENGPG